MIGMWTGAENRARLDRVNKALERRDLSEADRSELEDDRRELMAWLRDLERIEGP